MTTARRSTDLAAVDTASDVVSDLPEPGAFVAKFERYWSAPTAAAMATLLTDDVRLVQPLMRTTDSLAAGQAAFAKLLDRMPDLRARVDRWCAQGAVLYIDFRLSGTYAGERISWAAVDRILLRGDFACERVSYFDPTPIVRALLRHPSYWIDVLRTGLFRG